MQSLCSIYFILDVAIQLKDGSSDMTGRVAVKKYGVWGRVCSDFWDDNDATVACRQTGHMGGVSYRHNFAGNGPYFYNELRCIGNETRLEDCVTGTAKCQYTVDSGVLCYNSRGR